MTPSGQGEQAATATRSAPVRPRLSAVLPNYNHALFLPRAIDALMRQTRPADEVVIVDDGSTDDSVAVVEEAQQRHPAIRLVRNERNLGVTAAVDRGLAEATGDYVVFPAADDRVMPDFFALAMEAVERYPQVGLCTGANGVVDPESGAARPVGRCFPPGGYYPPDALVPYIRHGYHVGGLTSVVKRSSLDRAGGFLPQLAWFNDWFAFQLIAYREGMYVLPEMVAARTIRKESYLHAASLRQRVATADLVLDLLDQPEYADVRPLFRSGALGALHLAAAVAIVHRPHRWRWVSVPFLQLMAVDVVHACTPTGLRRRFSAHALARSARG